jgi:hypothetical protein
MVSSRIRVKPPTAMLLMDSTLSLLLPTAPAAAFDSSVMLKGKHRSLERLDSL